MTKLNTDYFNVKDFDQKFSIFLLGKLIKFVFVTKITPVLAIFLIFFQRQWRQCLKEYIKPE